MLIIFYINTIGTLPVIRVKGYTLVWKPNSTEEIFEYSLFFDDKVEPSPETLDIDLPQRAKSEGTMFMN